MRQRLATIARAVLLGWVTLLVVTYVVKRPLLTLLAHVVESSWFPTIRLGLECSALAFTGWVVGRVSRAMRLIAIVTFALTLVPWDFGQTLEIQVPWLLQLAADSFRDRHYWSSLIDTSVIQVFLFGSLFCGARLSRRAPVIPPSILDPTRQEMP
jgi:hypothetical protein